MAAGSEIKKWNGRKAVRRYKAEEETKEPSETRCRHPDVDSPVPCAAYL